MPPKKPTKKPTKVGSIQVYEPDHASISKLRDSLTNVVNRFMSKHGFVGEKTDPEDHIEGLRIAFAATSELLGLLDVPAHLYGVTMDERSKEMRLHWRNGRIQALKAHDKTCPGCAAAEELRRELAGS
jgi:hypothetical protein